MLTREIKSGDEVRQRIKQGIDLAADTVKVTLGARGRNVILDTNPYLDPQNVNDGVTIARELLAADRFANIGVKIVKKAAAKTNDIAGDGTTTASVLVQAIATEGMKVIAAGADPVSVRRGVELAARAVIRRIQTEAKTADDLDTLTHTATISCGDVILGRLVAETVLKAGAAGVITLEDNPEPETTAEGVEGLKLRGGYNLPLFVNVKELQQTVFKNVPVVVTNHNISLAQDMGRIMETVHLAGRNEAVLIANNIEADALLTIVKNWVEKRFFVLPLRVVAYGESGEGALRDVAAVTGATFIDAQANMRMADLTREALGRADKVVAGKHESTFITDDEEAKASRIAELQAQMEVTDREFERESLRERTAKLRSAMFTIKVGGITDTERQERRLRVEDAINATKAALTDGVVAGGGSALYRASMTEAMDKTELTDQALGFNAVLKACRAPLRQMAVNSSIELGKRDLISLHEPGNAIDFKTGNTVDAHKVGIIDPVKVVTCALENAASEVALFLVTEAAVVMGEQKEEPV